MSKIGKGLQRAKPLTFVAEMRAVKGNEIRKFRGHCTRMFFIARCTSNGIETGEEDVFFWAQ